MTRILTEETKQVIVNLLMNYIKDETTPANPDSVDIIKVEDCATDGHPENVFADLITTDLRFGSNVIRIPVLYYPTDNCIMLPCDWQGWLPESPEDIDRIEWYIMGTDTVANNMSGLPRIPSYIPQIPPYMSIAMTPSYNG